MKLDLLAIAAHPDDVELTCGGTLIKMAERGYKTGVLDLTAGEMGTRGTPETRAKESALATKFMGVQWRQVLGVPDSDVQASRQHKLRLAAVIREVRPRTVILPYWEARHPDHYHASTLGYEGCFLAGLKQAPLPGEAYRPFKILYSTAFVADVRPTLCRGYYSTVREAQEGHSGLRFAIPAKKAPEEEERACTWRSMSWKIR